MIERFDITIVGGGIVGLATAEAILQIRPSTRLVLFEKESRLAGHQSGRNSGVLHSGIYYKPGSLKARMAVAGRASMVRFCAEHGVAHEICGKVVVATRHNELGRLRELYDRGRRNGVHVEEIGTDRLRELEPHAAGIAALHVLDTGVVDFAEVCRALGRSIESRAGHVRLNQRVTGFGSGVVETLSGPVATKVVINCAGLHSDQVAQSGEFRIVPFRGEFHELVASRQHLVRHLIYPVPDPGLPFLGVHLTRGIHGVVHAGPNAILALAREGYSWTNIDGLELRGLIRFPGFRVLARRYWRVGAGELMRSMSRRLLARDLRRLVPEIDANDLVRSPAGVRAQALDRQGNLLDDFVIHETADAVHVVNAPSPAATASLEIGRSIATRALQRLS